MDGARYQQLRQDIIENWIKNLSRDILKDIAAEAFDIKYMQLENYKGFRKEIHVAPDKLRESLLKVARGEELDVVWMA